MSEPALILHSIVQSFTQGDNTLQVLRGTNLTIHAGEIVALLGPSGSGKSCLLHLAGLLEMPDAGEIIINGEIVTRDDKARTLLRQKYIGFIYQFHNLLPEFSALENVMLPARIAGMTKRVAKQRAHDLLGELGLQGRVTHLPGQLSGGEQQRVAIARALINEPKLVLADEPTGSLDQTTGAYVFDLLLDMARAHNAGVLMATHDETLAQAGDRITRLKQGVLQMQ